MFKKICLFIIAVAAIVFFCSCSIKSPDIYEIGSYKIVSLSAVCKQCSVTDVEHISETDQVRKHIFSHTIKYKYNEITPENITDYMARLEKDGYYLFSENCMQSKADNKGDFIEIKIDGNAVFISLGNNV